VFGVVNLSVIVIRESGARWYKPSYTLPGYPVVPILGFLGCLSLIVFMGPVALIGGGGIVGFGLVWYFAYARKRVNRKGAASRLYGDRRRISGRMSGQRTVKTSGVIIPIFARDEDIEDLIPLGGMLAEKDCSLNVLRIEEVPDQTTLAMFEETDQLTEEIASRVDSVAKQHRLACTFEDIVTHHAKHVLYERAVTEGSNWIVMRWQPRSPWRWFVTDPVAWFIHHPPSDLILFRETPDTDGAGLDRFKRILIFAEPGPNDALVTHVADRFALTVAGAKLTFAHLLSAEADEAAEDMVRSYHQGLRELCSSDVGDAEVLRNDDELVALLDFAKEFDLLILGAPAESEGSGVFRGAFEDRIVEQAPCAVLRVKAAKGRSHASLARAAYPSNLPNEGKNDSRRLPRDPEFHLGDLLARVEILAGSTIRNKNQLFKALAEGFEESYGKELPSVEDALWQREKKQLTALGHGVAVPHVTLDSLDRTYLEIWILDEGVDFKDTRKELVNVVFAVYASPGARRLHLRTLARIGRLVLLPDFLPLLRACESEAQVRELIRAHEDELK
jgi:mannitol/fructose-specific phosphotransferase system IIA component (Ntr-type)/nucleotide-binding universal stress UspA family protein